MRVRLIGMTMVAVAVIYPGTLHAQQARERPMVLVVPGATYARATFGDDDPKSDAGPGFTIGVQLRGQRSRSTAFVFEATFQPNAPENPHYPEKYAPLYVQAGAQIGRRIYVRPSGGVALQSGSFAPLLGIAIGRERSLGTRYLAAPEFVIRTSSSHGLFGWIVGVQVPIGVRPSTGTKGLRARAW